MSSDSRRALIRCYGALVAGIVALLMVARPDGEEFNCRGERLSFRALADRRGISGDYIGSLRALGFTAQTLCEARGEIVQQGIRMVDRARTGHAKPDSPGEYLEWRKLSLRDENGNIDPGGLLRAKAHVDLMRSQAVSIDVANITRGAWTSIGPGNIGGRIRAMVILPGDGNTMFIGSVGGGIWKTTNGGSSWAPVDDFMANLSVSSIVIDPSNANTMYAGTGEGYFNADGIQGAGIFKSTNGGSTWAQLASTSASPSAGLSATDFHYVNRLAMNSNGTVLLAATRTGLYRSTDGGSSFTRATMVGGGAISAGSGITDVDFKPGDVQTAVAATFAGTALYSTNGGSTWSSAGGMPGSSSFRRVETAFATSSPAIVYAAVDLDNGSLYKSTDSGVSYTEVHDGAAANTINVLGTQGWYDNLLWVSPADPNFVVWGGVDLWRSTNGGVEFARMSAWNTHSYSNPTSAHADHHIAVAHPGFDGSSNQTVFFGNDGGVYRATDVSTVGGEYPFHTGWTELNNGLAITQFYGGAGNSGSGKITGGTQDNGTLLYNPALSSPSENWTAPFGGDGGFSAYDSSDSNYFYGEYIYALIHRNTTGGSSGSSFITSGLTDAGYSATADFIAAFVLDPGNNNRLLVAASQLWRTTNVKAATPTWESIKSSIGSKVSAIGMTAQNGNVIYAGHNSGQLYRTNSGAADAATTRASWETLDNNGTSNPLPNRRMTRITVGDAVNSLHQVYVTFGGFSDNNIYKSTDGGNTWADITGPSGGASALPAVPVRDLEIHPYHSNWLYAATEVGVFASANGGSTWALPHDGPANVSVDELFFMGTRLVAVTHGRGMFSIETGGSFTDDPLVAGVTPVKAVHIDELRARINAVRQARGLSAFSFTDSSLVVGSFIIKAAHVLEMRTALAAAYTAAGLTPPTFTDASLSAINMKAIHITELRAAVVAIE